MPQIEFLDPAGTVLMRDTARSGWVYHSLDDWYSLSSDKTEQHERPTAHGAFRARRSLRSAASMAVEAHFLADSALELVDALDRIGALGVDGPILMRVTDEKQTTEREVRVRTVDVPDYHARSVDTITVELSADDPRRYSVGDAWVVGSMPSPPSSGLIWPLKWPLIWGSGGAESGRLTLTNRGTKASAPIYRIYGGFDAVELVEMTSQQRVGFDLIVPAGSYVEIDFRTRRAVLNGQSDVSRYLTYREWWTVPAGSEVTVSPVFDGEGPTASYQGMVRSAW